MTTPNLTGIWPAIVTPFETDGTVDYDGLATYCGWLSSVPGVNGIVVNAHAGEVLALQTEERIRIIQSIKAACPDLPVAAGVTGEGTMVAGGEAEDAANAGADAILVFPAASWLRFGYQDGAPQDRYRTVRTAAGLPLILFQYPDITKATYRLPMLLELCSVDGVVALKDGARDMVRWDTETPILRNEFPALKILTCQDEFLLHTMWEADGALVGFAALIPELLVEMYGAARRHEYGEAKEIYDRILPLSRVVYHRTSHMEATVAMKLGLAHRGLIKTTVVRSPLMPLEPGAALDIADALERALAQGALA